MAAKRNNRHTGTTIPLTVIALVLLLVPPVAAYAETCPSAGEQTGTGMTDVYVIVLGDEEPSGGDNIHEEVDINDPQPTNDRPRQDSDSPSGGGTPSTTTATVARTGTTPATVTPTRQSWKDVLLQTGGILEPTPVMVLISVGITALILWLYARRRDDDEKKADER